MTRGQERPVPAARDWLAFRWDRFFFDPQPVAGIALFRVLWGLVLLGNWLLLGGDLLTWFGEGGLLSGETASRLTGGHRLSVLALLPAGDGWVVALYAASVLASLSLTVGFCTRPSAAVVFLGLVSLHHRNPLILHSGDTLLRVVTFLLIFAPSGAALSLDHWRRARGRESAEPPRRAPWAQRLLQIQVTVVYLSTFLWKIEGAPWQDGTALYYMSRLVEFQRFPVPFLFEHLWTIRALTWGSLLLELALGTLIWVRRLRYPLLLAGVVMHLGIEYSMNIPVFQWAMIVALTSFLDPAHVETALARLRQVLRLAPARRDVGVSTADPGGRGTG